MTVNRTVLQADRCSPCCSTADVGDIAAVVTRYYGGTKLGTGGLVKAYSGVVQQALDGAPRTMRITRTDVVVRVAYTAISAVQQCCRHSRPR